MEVRINKEIRDYQEAVFFGLSLRQFIFSALAVGAAVAVYFCLRSAAADGGAGWACVLAALPFALCGFVRYNGMSAERLALAFIRAELFMPRHLPYRSTNLYAAALEHSSVKEVLAHD